MKVARVLLKPLAYLLLFATRTAYRLWLRYAEIDQIEGIPFVDLARGDAKARAASIQQAIGLLAGVQPYRLAQVRRYLRWLIVSYTGGSGEYWYGMGVCVLDADYIEASAPIDIAMLLVHEMTHGRLDKRRIRTTSANHDRIEELCVKAELELADQLPEGTDLVVRVRRRLEQRWWDDSQHVARQRRRLVQHRAPRWIMRMYDRVARR